MKKILKIKDRVGIIQNGVYFIAMAHSDSKQFKTLAGAEKWLARKGWLK